MRQNLWCIRIDFLIPSHVFNLRRKVCRFILLHFSHKSIEWGKTMFLHTCKELSNMLFLVYELLSILYFTLLNRDRVWQGSSVAWLWDICRWRQPAPVEGAAGRKRAPRTYKKSRKKNTKTIISQKLTTITQQKSLKRKISGRSIPI